jgi:hypothetical protein
MSDSSSRLRGKDSLLCKTILSAKEDKQSGLVWCFLAYLALFAVKILGFGGF